MAVQYIRKCFASNCCHYDDDKRTEREVMTAEFRIRNAGQNLSNIKTENSFT